MLEELEAASTYLGEIRQRYPQDLSHCHSPRCAGEESASDYSRQQVVGWDLVESYGGRIALAPLIDGKSTSAVISKILEAHRDTPER